MLHFAERSSCRIGAFRCSAGALDTGVHVRFVIIADIQYIMAAFHSPGKCLDTDIIGTAVTAESDEIDLLIDLLLPEP